MNVWTVATGEVNPWKKKSREAVDYIKTLEGLVAVHPAHGHGTLWLFDSENNAKGAKNLMEHNGIKTGRNICKARIEGGTLVLD